MSAPDENFKRRFPGYSARVDHKPNETPEEPALSKGEGIAAILHAALPLLAEHADREPFAVPIVAPRRIVGFSQTIGNRHVAGWVAGSFETGGPSSSNPHGLHNTLLLTEDGQIGIGYKEDDHGAHFSGALTRIDRLGEESLGTIDETEVYTRLRGILHSAGVEFESPIDIAPDSTAAAPPRPTELSVSEEIRTSRGIIR